MYSFNEFHNDSEQFVRFQRQYSKEYNSALKTIVPEEIIEDEDFIKNNLKLVFVIGSVFFKEDKDNLNKQKQERLEEFITSNIERYVKRYEQIGVIQSYDPVET